MPARYPSVFPANWQGKTDSEREELFAAMFTDWSPGWCHFDGDKKRDGDSYIWVCDHCGGHLLQPIDHPKAAPRYLRDLNLIVPFIAEHVEHLIRVDAISIAFSRIEVRHEAKSGAIWQPEHKPSFMHVMTTITAWGGTVISHRDTVTNFRISVSEPSYPLAIMALYIAAHRAFTEDFRNMYGIVDCEIVIGG